MSTPTCRGENNEPLTADESMDYVESSFHNTFVGRIRRWRMRQSMQAELKRQEESRKAFYPPGMWDVPGNLNPERGTQ